MTIVHSDLTNNNMMLTLSKPNDVDSGEEQVYLIDWQTCFIANNPLIDLAFLLYYAIDADLLTQDFETQLINFYHQCLMRHGAKPDLTLKICEQMFEEALLLAFVRWANGSGIGLYVTIGIKERSERFIKLLQRL